MSADFAEENVKDSNPHHHTAFAYLFLFVACISLYRVYIYYDFSHRGKVVTIFYSLICFTSLLRSIWFFLFSFSNIYYIPLSLTTITDVGAGACLLSQILSSLGSIGLYLIFILIACYWFQLLRDTSSTANTRPTNNNNNNTNNIRTHDNNKNRSQQQFNAILDESDEESGNSYGITRYLEDNNISMIPLFFVCSVILIFLNLLNLFLFMLNVFNSEDMILYDSVILSIVSLITLLVLSKLSKKIKKLLIMIGAINNNSTQAQIRRIVAITYAANCFFVVRVGIELSLLVSFLILYINHQSLTVILADQYWDLYVVLKYSFELAILALELVISTAIKTYATSSTTTAHHHGHNHPPPHHHHQQQHSSQQSQQQNTSVAPPTRSSNNSSNIPTHNTNSSSNNHSGSSSSSTSSSVTTLNINKNLESKALSAATASTSSSGIRMTTLHQQQQKNINNNNSSSNNNNSSNNNTNNVKSNERTPLLPTTTTTNTNTTTTKQTFNI